jgi:FMN-dependent NADH-azoreductase
MMLPFAFTAAFDRIYLWINISKMKNILHIISSPRGEASFSIRLGQRIIESLQTAIPETTVKVHDLTNGPFPHLEGSHLNAFFTRPENRTSEHMAYIRQSEEAIDELFESDIIVIGVPVYNLNIHSTLKAWIDHIVRGGRTVRFGEPRPEGLVRDKKVYLAICSAGVYSEGPMKQFDFVVPYLKSILNLIGITDIHVLRIEGSSDPAKQTVALEQTMAGFLPA